jgi:MFS family permease
MPATSTPNPMSRVLSLRDFRLLFAGSTTSLLGDQFALIAIPWLVLKLTGDPLMLGINLALEGIPRAVFMLVGGAVTDRVSPRLVMLISDIIRLILTGLMVVAIFAGKVEMWMVYGFSLGFGLVAGFAVPAANSIVPMLVAKDDLQAGNAIIMGASQLAQFVGPTIAGMLIGGYSTSSLGIGLAFAVDAVSFAISSVCLWLMRSGARQSSSEDARENIWTSILLGIKYLWNDPALRVLFLILAAVNFLSAGPLLVGIPVLANQRLAEGAVAFGLLMSGYAGGSLAGILLAGSLPRPIGNQMSICLLALLVAFGLVLGVFGFIHSTWVDFGLLLLLGVGVGYIQILMFTWMQARTPKIMLGRLMSMVMLAGNGLIPVSQAISGAVGKYSLEILFLSVGVLLFLVALWAAFQPGLWAFGQGAAAPEQTE